MSEGQGELFKLPERKLREVPRDEIWDALEDAFGQVRTKSERGRRNRAVRELKEAGATLDELATVLDYCKRNFTVYTEMAVCSWFSRALHEKKDVDSFADIIELAMRDDERRRRL